MAKKAQIFCQKDTGGSRGNGHIEEAKWGEKADATEGNQNAEVLNIVEKLDNSKLGSTQQQKI